MVLACSEARPIATLCVPVVFATRAFKPTAVLSAATFASKAFVPIAVLPDVVVFNSKEPVPIEVLFVPVVFADKAA